MGAGLKALHLLIPSAERIPTGELNERRLARLVHDLATTFGALRLVGLDATVRGDWSGKTPEESDREVLLVEPGGSPIVDAWRRDVEMCRRPACGGRVAPPAECVRRVLEPSRDAVKPGGELSARMGCALDGQLERATRTEMPTRPAFPVRAIAFDLDSTLVDIIRVKERAAEAAAWALADAGVDLSPDDAARDMMSIAYEIGIDHDDVVDEYLRRRVPAAAPHVATLARRAYEQAEEESVVAYPRVRRTLAELARRGYPLVLITDAPRHRALRRLRAARLLTYFSDLISGEDTPHGKADARPFAIATRRLGIEPHELLMVGDNPRRDVGVARAFGCRTALATYGLQEVFASDDPLHAADVDLRWADELLALMPPRQEASTSPPFDGP